MFLKGQVMRVLSFEKKEFDPPRGGLLTLAGLALIFTPFRMIYSLVVDFGPIFINRQAHNLLFPSSPNYNPVLATIVIVETLANISFLVAFIFLGFAFFQRRRFVPKMFILVLLANLAFVTGDALLVLKLYPQNVTDFSFLREAAIMLFHCIVFVPYFIFSKKVQETFIR